MLFKHLQSLSWLLRTWELSIVKCWKVLGLQIPFNLVLVPYNIIIWETANFKNTLKAREQLYNGLTQEALA